VLDLENTIRHSLKAFGIRIKGTGRGGFDAAVREAVADDALTSELMDAMLAPRRCFGRNTAGCTIWWRHAPRDLSALLGESGGGLVTALSFVTAIDGPSRFHPSRDVAAYFGLTSRRWQSGTSIDVQGRISKAGDPDVRRALYEAASALMTRFKGREKVRRRAWRWPGATAISR
jgi:transposase